MLAGAIAVAAWSYIKARLIPEAKAQVEASLVGGAIGGNDLRLILESVQRLETIGTAGNAALDDCQQSTDRVERAVRDLTASNERTAQMAAQALTKTGEETRRVAEKIDSLMRGQTAASLPPGRWSEGG